MNPRRIIVPEYDTIRIVPSLGAEEKIIPKSISKQEAESIRAFQRGSGRTFFNIGPHRLTTTNWVGSFSIGDLCIDVIPKIYTEKTE